VHIWLCGRGGWVRHGKVGEVGVEQGRVGTRRRNCNAGRPKRLIPGADLAGS
jgi:hypothetical protein